MGTVKPRGPELMGIFRRPVQYAIIFSRPSATISQEGAHITMVEITFNVPGMYADHHVSVVVKVLKGQPGVDGVVASSLHKKVTVGYDPVQMSPQKLGEALEAAGYPAERGEGVLRDEDLDIRRSQ